MAALDRSSTKTAGLELKYPAISTDVGYTSYHDGAAGGISGDQTEFNLAADADIFDGLIAGVSYGFVGRDGDDGAGTNEDQSDHALSLYAAKRLADLVNVGGSFAFITSNHDLSGVTAADLDGETYCLNAFVGVSKTWDKLSASTTASIVGNFQHGAGETLETCTGIWSGSLGYQVLERLKGSFNWWFNYVMATDTLPGASTPERDSWVLGPKLDFLINDHFSVNLAYNYSSGPDQFDAHTVRFGGEFRF